MKNSKRTPSSGALVAFLGAALVIFNGKFILKLNPIGDLLAILSAVAWAVYSIIIRNLGSKHSTYYITRKIFFYTILTILPVLLISPVRLDFKPLLDPVLAANLLFLTLFASCAAYVVWSKVIWTIRRDKSKQLHLFHSVIDPRRIRNISIRNDHCLRTSRRGADIRRGIPRVQKIKVELKGTPPHCK